MLRPWNERRIEAFSPVYLTSIRPARHRRGLVRRVLSACEPQGPARYASIHESSPIRSRPMHSNLNDIIPISSSAVPRQVPSSTLISSNPGLRSVWRAVQMVAGTTSSVLIQGETGTGKELVARAVHDESPRRHGPYVK